MLSVHAQTLLLWPDPLPLFSAVVNACVRGLNTSPSPLPIHAFAVRAHTANAPSFPLPTHPIVCAFAVLLQMERERRRRRRLDESATEREGRLQRERERRRRELSPTKFTIKLIPFEPPRSGHLSTPYNGH